MSDISFLTESVTGMDRCCKEIVGIDLPECCLSLGSKFNLLVGHGRSERSDGTESPGTIY